MDRNALFRQKILPTALLTALAYYLGYCTNRTDFSTCIIPFSLFFGLYAWICFAWKNPPLSYFLFLGIALRVLLVFSLPGLSDDYFRFLWDGRLTVAGIHPFSHPPRYFIEQGILPPGITEALFQKLNSPDYYTVYPPVCQAVFALAAWIAPANDWLGVVVIKTFLLACEIGTIRLLYRFDRGAAGRPSPALLYALNPLALLEICGNAHFEGAMIFFLLAGILALQKGAVRKSALYLALATATKLLPLMFLPLLWYRLNRLQRRQFSGVFVLAVLVLFIPLLPVLPRMATSLDLYFRQFQFNASAYYLVRQVFYVWQNWDIGERSGPVLALITVIGIVWLARQLRFYRLDNPRPLWAAMLFSLFLYLSLSAVVQPWYVCVPLAVSLFTPYRFAIIWSGLVVLSYSHYDGGVYREHYGWIALEYGLLWAFCVMPASSRVLKIPGAS